MKFVLTIITLTCLLSACGADLTGRKFRQEKDSHHETTQKLGETQGIYEVTKELMSNVVQSRSLQWAFAVSGVGVPINTRDKAAQLCRDVGFTLPTTARLQGEGLTVDRIKNISGNLGIASEHMVYVKDEDTQSPRFVVCVREIPAS